MSPGHYVNWSGQFEYLERAEARLELVVPVTLLIVFFLLLYLNFRTLTETLIVMLSLPFSVVGGLWLLWALGFNLSVAVAVGFIALAGGRRNRHRDAALSRSRIARAEGERRCRGQDVHTDDLREAINGRTCRAGWREAILMCRLLRDLRSQSVEYSNDLKLSCRVAFRRIGEFADCAPRSACSSG